MPRLSYSSSATAAMMISPRAPACAARHAAAHIAAMPPFMSARAAAVEPAVALLGARRAGAIMPSTPDHVEVAVEHQRAPAAAPPPMRAMRLGRPGAASCELRAEAPRVQHVAQQLGARALARRARGERRIARVDPHELARERARVARRDGLSSSRFVGFVLLGHHARSRGSRSSSTAIGEPLAERRECVRELVLASLARDDEHAAAARRAERLHAERAGVSAASQAIAVDARRW